MAGHLSDPFPCQNQLPTDSAEIGTYARYAYKLISHEVASFTVVRIFSVLSGEPYRGTRSRDQDR